MDVALLLVCRVNREEKSQEARQMMNAFQSGPRIFVSHSSKDVDFGRRLVHDLRQSLGSEDAVWYDSEGGLNGGDTWWKVIVRELTARPIFIVILSPQALESKWVDDEVNIAWKQRNSTAGKYIIPILYQACSVPEYLDTLQIVSFMPPASYESAFQRLVTSINLITQKGAQQNAAISKEIANGFIQLLKSDDEKPHLPAFTLPERDWLPLDRHSVVGQAPIGEKTKVQWVEEGDKLYTQHRYQEAQNAYEQALLIDNKLALAHYGKANCLYSMKNLPAALSAYEHAIELDPMFAKSYAGKGGVLRDMQRYSEALTAFDQFIRISPQYAFMYVNKGDLLMMMVRPRDALNSYEQALRIEPNNYSALNGKNMALQAITMNPFSNQFF